MDPIVIDLGAGPTSEPCAQLGHTAGFATVNRLEVAAYRAALVARYGSPPQGCELIPTTSRHDFGFYTTLTLRIDRAAASDAEAHAYAQAVEDGIDHWHDVNFTAPASYSGSTAVRVRTLDDTIAGAINSTRPLPYRSKLADDFALIHANLTAAYPDHAIGGRLNPMRVAA